MEEEGDIKGNAGRHLRIGINGGCSEKGAKRGRGGEVEEEEALLEEWLWRMARSGVMANAVVPPF